MERKPLKRQNPRREADLKTLKQAEGALESVAGYDTGYTVIAAKALFKILTVIFHELVVANDELDRIEQHTRRI